MPSSTVQCRRCANILRGPPTGIGARAEAPSMGAAASPGFPSAAAAATTAAIPSTMTATALPSAAFPPVLSKAAWAPPLSPSKATTVRTRRCVHVGTNLRSDLLLGVVSNSACDASSFSISETTSTFTSTRTADAGSSAAGGPAAGASARPRPGSAAAGGSGASTTPTAARPPATCCQEGVVLLQSRSPAESRSTAATAGSGCRSAAARRALQRAWRCSTNCHIACDRARTCRKRWAPSAWKRWNSRIASPQ
mmetsp:Transcript_124952/g.400272  ORF Transcript_124952/g.400272 Transcript_124952/m.400272 type:complete len:252 (+) Transcript_124952:344-1099(+)